MAHPISSWSSDQDFQLGLSLGHCTDPSLEEIVPKSQGCICSTSGYRLQKGCPRRAELGSAMLLPRWGCEQAP